MRVFFTDSCCIQVLFVNKFSMDNKGKNIEQHNIGDFLDFCKPKDVRYVLAATIIYVALGVILR